MPVLALAGCLDNHVVQLYVFGLVVDYSYSVIQPRSVSMIPFTRLSFTRQHLLQYVYSETSDNGHILHLRKISILQNTPLIPYYSTTY